MFFFFVPEWYHECAMMMKVMVMMVTYEISKRKKERKYGEVHESKCITAIIWGFSHPCVCGSRRESTYACMYER